MCAGRGVPLSCTGARRSPPPHVALALKLKHSKLKGGVYRQRRSARSGATVLQVTNTTGSWRHKAHTTHLLVTWTVTFPF